jgi:serine/threonine-protein kinase RsbW
MSLPTRPGDAASGWPDPRGARLALPAARSADLASVRAHVAAACRAADAATRDALVLAADEMCANVLLHAYGGAPGPLTVDAQAGPAAGGDATVCHHVTIIDAGPPFDPTAVPLPDVTRPAEARPVGGLGLLLVRRSVDALRYARVGGHNVVTLEKRAAVPSPSGAP